jgi:lipopolysaccharide transport system permease protein
MQRPSKSPTAIFANLWLSRSLAIALVKRDVIGRYRGSFMGILWSLLNPLVLLSAYTFVFSKVFKVRWVAEHDQPKTEFALILFAGLLVFNLFSECIMRAPTLITTNQNYVKKLRFPLDILPWISIGSALFHLIVSLGVWLVFYSLVVGAPNSTVLWLPAVLAPFILLILGCSWILASLGVYLRDVSHITGILTSCLMFLSPTFYPLSALPGEWQRILLLNPLTIPMEMMRGVLFFGIPPDLFLLALYSLAAMLIACVGFASFQAIRRGFSDAL